jgi:hypothetical protein
MNFAVPGYARQLGADSGQLSKLVEQHVSPVGGAVLEHRRTDAHDEPHPAQS